jgi:hypothetical protein
MKGWVCRLLVLLVLASTIIFGCKSCRTRHHILLSQVRDYIYMSQGSSAVIMTGYRLDGRGSIPSRDKRYFFSPQCPDQLWGPPTLLSSGYWGLFLQRKSGWSMRLITHLHLLPRLRMVDLYLQPHIFVACCLIN